MKVARASIVQFDRMRSLTAFGIAMAQVAQSGTPNEVKESIRFEAIAGDSTR